MERPPSGCPAAAATPKLVVPTAGKPAAANASADATSHALGSRNGSVAVVQLAEAHDGTRRSHSWSFAAASPTLTVASPIPCAASSSSALKRSV